MNNKPSTRHAYIRQDGTLIFYTRSYGKNGRDRWHRDGALPSMYNERGYAWYKNNHYVRYKLIN